MNQPCQTVVSVLSKPLVSFSKHLQLKGPLREDCLCLSSSLPHFHYAAHTSPCHFTSASSPLAPERLQLTRSRRRRPQPGKALLSAV